MFVLVAYRNFDFVFFSGYNVVDLCEFAAEAFAGFGEVAEGENGEF